MIFRPSLKLAKRIKVSKQKIEWTSGDGVHFNGQGNEALAKQVAESVSGFLPASGK